jgi:hypothetical protein
MQLQTILPTVIALAAGAQAAGTTVKWFSCGSDSQTTVTEGDSCTNVSGFKTENLCRIEVPPPGSDRCEFYTTMCGNPFGKTYNCDAGHVCDTSGWDAIDSYRCYQ